MAAKKINPILKMVLELGPVVAFFIAFLFIWIILVRFIFVRLTFALIFITCFIGWQFAIKVRLSVQARRRNRLFNFHIRANRFHETVNARRSNFDESLRFGNFNRADLRFLKSA